MKIKINNQEFEETSETQPISNGVWYQNKWYKPVSTFKEGDWIMFYYYGAQNEIVIDRIKEWTTHSYCKLEGGLEPFKELIAKATYNEIYNHLKEEAIKKGLVKGALICRLDGNNKLEKDYFFTISEGDGNYYPETDEFAKSGLVLYRKGKWVEKVNPLFTSEDGVDIYKGSAYFVVHINKLDLPRNASVNTVYGPFYGRDLGSSESWSDTVKFFSTESKAQEYINKNKPKLTFGGYECNFNLFNSGLKYNFKTIEVTCKGETGTHFQIEEILKNYFRPCKFGNVEVKQFTLKNTKMNLNNQLVIETNAECYDENNVGEVQIGCLVGKYSELVAIFNHCLDLLK